MRHSYIQALRASVAVAMICTALALLPGCTMVGERTTGLQLSTDGPTDCVKDCYRTFFDALAAETKRSLQNLEACKQLPTSSQRDACVKAELARYKAAVEALYAQKLECINGCHAQGSGSAG